MSHVRFYVTAAVGALLMSLGPNASAAPDFCPGQTTLGVEACLQSELRRAEEVLERYTAAAAEQIGLDDASGAILRSFREAGAEWAKYRRAECNAIYEYWSKGTIRGAMSLTCARRLTDARTHEVWEAWLTYGDRTPPVLPEPVTEPRR